MQSHAKTLKAHTGVDDASGQRLEFAVGHALELHEHEVPDFDNLWMILIYKLDAGQRCTLGIATQVDVYLATRAARSGITHFPEIVMTIAVNDMILGQVLFPDGSGFVIAPHPVGLVAFEHGGIKASRIQFEYVHQVFPRPVDGFLFEVIAERPVAEHLEHCVVVGVHSDFFEVIVLAGHSQAFLRISNTAILGRCISQYDILELVHAGVCKHQRGVVFDDHGGRRDYFVSLRLEKLLERIAYLL